MCIYKEQNGATVLRKSAKCKLLFQSKEAKNESAHAVNTFLVTSSVFRLKKKDQVELENVAALHNPFKVSVKEEVTFVHFLP